MLKSRSIKDIKEIVHAKKTLLHIVALHVLVYVIIWVR